MRATSFAALLCAALLVCAGCGAPPAPHGSQPPAQTHISPGAIQVPPESARTPEGAHNAVRPSTLSLGHAIHIDSAGLRLIEGFEGYSRCAYWDPYGRVWTVGFGQTRGAYQGFCFTGRAAAEANLKASVVREYEWAVHAIGYPFNQNEVDALDSFAYNLGAGIFTGALRGDLQHGLVYQASRIMLKYDHAGGVVLPGLRTRREQEVRLLLTPARKPVPLSALYTRRRVLRRVLLAHDCDRRRDTRQKLGKTCTRWFHEGAAVNTAIRIRT